MNDISCPGFCCCWTLCPVSSRRYQASAFAATCHHCDCGCIFHTSSVGPWFFGLGFLMAETLLVVDTCPCGVVLFARSKEKCTHQSVEFIKEWDFHRSLIYETANCLLWLFREKVNMSNKALSWLSVQSYGAYIVHLPLMILIQYLFDEVWMGAFGKFMFVGVVTTLLSFTLTWLLRLLPGVKRII